jgi:hypothetical protein
MSHFTPRERHPTTHCVGSTAGLDATKKEQDRQCTYNVKLRRNRKSLWLWKSNKYYIVVCLYARVGVQIVCAIL